MTGVKHIALNKVYFEDMTSRDGWDSEALLHTSFLSIAIITLKELYQAINLYQLILRYMRLLSEVSGINWVIHHHSNNSR
jgi:hypothetical protein